MKKISIIVCSVIMSSLYARAVAEDSLHYARLHHEDINYFHNSMYGTDNPVQLSFNKSTSLMKATISGQFHRGDFHAVDQSSEHNALNVHILGFQDFGRLKLSGDIAYTNSKDIDHRWNNTLMTSPLNPFIICDSLFSDVTTDLFDMNAAASYTFSKKFIGALKLHYVTGSLADQSDPRPKTNAMRFNIKPGAYFTINQNLAVGADAFVEFYHSDIVHTLENTLNSYIYFVMKGMGDRVDIPANEQFSRPRDYTGTKYGASLQLNYHTKSLGDVLQLSYSRNGEDAIDGGSSFEYRSGDYKDNTFSVLNHFTLHMSPNYQHHLIIQYEQLKDEGDWYEQRRRLDSDHGNLVYYEIMAKNRIREAKQSKISATYRLDKFTNSLPDWHASLSGDYLGFTATQDDGMIYKQKYQMMNLRLEGTKYWNVKTSRLETRLGAFMTSQMGEPKYATPLANTDYSESKRALVSTYVNPMFEYNTAASIGFQARVAYNHPIRINGKYTWWGVHAQVQQAFYTGNNKYAQCYDGANRTLMNVGLDLTF